MTTVLNLATVTRVELKKEIVEAIMADDIVAAKIRLIVLDELISEEGFESIEEINEYYQVRRLVNQF